MISPSNFLRRFLKLILTIFGILFFLLLTTFLVLKSSKVQTYLTRKVSSYLSKEYNTVVSAGNVNLSLFDGLVLKDLYVEDRQKDTLLYIHYVGVFPKNFPSSASKLKFRKIAIDSLYVNIYQLPDSIMNFQFIADYFASEDEQEDEKSEMLIQCNDFEITKSRLVYRELNPDSTKGLNYGDISVNEFNFIIDDFELKNDDISFASANISLREQCGFKLDSLYIENGLIKPQGIRSSNFIFKTPRSFVLISQLNLSFNSWDDFDDFSNSVKMNASFVPGSRMVFDDINTFLSDPVFGIEDVAIGGHLYGTVNDLDIKDLSLRLGNIFRIETSSKLSNITMSDSLGFDAKIKHILVNTDRLSAIKMGNSDSSLISVPKEAENLKRIEYSGEASGDLDDFFTAGQFTGSFGKLSMRFTGGRDSLRSIFLYGHLIIQNIDLGKTLANDDLGVISMQQDIDFAMLRDEKIEFETNGIIDSVQYKGYNHKAINIFARMRNMTIDSFFIKTNRPDLQFELKGSADFTAGTPSISFTADADHINLKAIHIDTEHKKSLVSFNLAGDFIGGGIDDFIGELKLKEPLYYTSDTVSVKINEFTFSSNIASFVGGQQVKQYYIDSDILDARIRITGQVEDVAKDIENTITRFLPLSNEIVEFDSINADSKLELVCNLKKANLITRFFDPTIVVSNTTKITTTYDAREDFLGFLLTSDFIKTDDIIVNDFSVQANTENKNFILKIGSSDLEVAGQFHFNDFKVNADFLEKNADFNVLWSATTESYSNADIQGKLSFDTKDSAMVISTFIDSSYVTVEGKKWQFGNAEIISDSTYLSVNDLYFTYKDQQIYIDGDVSNNPNSEILVGFNKFELNNFSSFLPEDMSIDGEMTGNFRLKEVYKDLFILSNDTIKSLTVNGIDLGDLFLKSDWNSSSDNMGFTFYNKQGDTSKGFSEQIIDSVYGKYWPSKDSIYVVGKFEGFQLRTFKSLYKEHISFRRSSQFASDFVVSGYINDPQVKGTIVLRGMDMTVKYLETQYSVNQKLSLSFDNNLIRIDTTKLFSANGGVAFLGGDVRHNSFKDFDFDIHLKTQKFQFINTHPADTASFYGTAYGSGEIYVRGSPDDLTIDVDMKTDNDTYFFVPLSSGEALSEEQSFMVFKEIEKEEKDDDNVKEEIESEQGGDMTLNLKLDVTPGAELQLIMDEQTGDIIKVRGTGDLNIGINPAGDFNMFGNFTIDKGSYLFTLQNFFSKRFTIRKGGTINWTGDPEDADVDLTAAYSLQNVGLYSLLVDPKMQNAKTNVDCVIDMKGDLGNPLISFDIEFPEDEERVSQQVATLEQDAKNEQFLSLLLMGGFQPLPGLSQEMSGGSPVKIGELVSNQLNRRLENITDDVDVGVNYQTGNDISTDELEVALSTHLWNDRITLKGNFGVGGGLRESGSESGKDNLVGELEMNLKLTPSGKLQLKAYNKANDEFTYDKGLYTQGVGFFWRHEFDKLRLFKSKDSTKVLKD